MCIILHNKTIYDIMKITLDIVTTKAYNKKHRGHPYYVKE